MYMYRIYPCANASDQQLEPRFGCPAAIVSFFKEYVT